MAGVLKVICPTAKAKFCPTGCFVAASATVSREAAFLLPELSYMRESLDRRKRGQSFQPGHGMVNRFSTAQSTVAMRRWVPSAIVTLAAMAALTALTAGAAAKQARPAPPTEATAP